MLHSDQESAHVEQDVMSAKINGLQLRFIALFSGIALIAFLAVATVILMLGKQTEDAQFVALSGQQSVLTQRLLKLSLLVERDVSAGQNKAGRADTLHQVLSQLRKLHYKLLDQSKTQHNSPTTDSLLRSSTPYFESTFAAASNMTATNDGAIMRNALSTIVKNDEVLVFSTQRILESYQQHAYSKLRNFRMLLVVIAVVSTLAVLIVVALVLRPSLRKLERNNKELLVLNEQLHSSYKELQISEEEIRASRDHIQTLQEHLGAKEKQYRDLVENANDIIYELDEQARFTYINPVTELITGFDKAELIGTTYWKLVVEEYKREVTDFYVQQIKERCERSYYEFPIRTADGTIIWLGQSVYFTFLEDGWVTKVNVVARDITRLRQIQEKLSESERLYRLISNNSMDLISLYDSADHDLVRVFVSPSVKEILGFEQHEVIGRSLYDFIHPEDVQRMREHKHSVALSGKPVIVEYRTFKKDGTLIWMESNVQPYFDEHGKMAGVQTSARDITERKQTEMALNQAKEKAEEATIAKSQFLSMISHEIRTPMNAVIGLTHFLLEESPKESQLKYLRLLRFSGESLLTIINDILDFSKIEAGKISFEYVSVRLKSFLNDIVLPMKMRANEKGILLLMKVDPNIPEVITIDPVRVGQVINNLLSNAIKFTMNGSVQFFVEHEGIHDGLHQLSFRVKDSGIGIEADKLDYIFESFSQANPDTTRKFGGTGLGLTITKRLLQLMGTDIFVESKMGVGSEFKFKLNVKESSLAAVAYENDFSSREEVQRKNDRTHVLLAEDNDVTQVVVMNYLEKWGYKVTVANNGKEVLHLIQEKTFHILLIDLQMPEIDGYQATKLIREMDDPYFKTVPILALTASAMPDVADELMRIGMNDYLSKPFKAKDLDEKIIKHRLSSIPVEADRSLQSSLDAYSGGDQEVNLDLARRMVKNINDLQAAIVTAINEDDIEGYIRCSHKMRTTISILRNEEFATGLEEVKQALLMRKETAAQLKARVESFNAICKQKIDELTDFYVSALS
ncbi:MAG: hypothetical protein DI538_14100 [Azospira oryzae]|nr:MAG: hypothetical protein DI538_14100 [Azospira oryzae]